jgi:hypothetical protein
MVISHFVLGFFFFVGSTLVVHAAAGFGIDRDNEPALSMKP